MFKKIEYFLKNMHFGHVLIGLVTLIIIVTFLTFLFGWKAPLSLKNKRDKNDIHLMLENTYPNSEFTNLSLHTVIFTDLIDSLIKINPSLEGELEYKTKTVFYDKITNGDTVTCATIFELEDKFLKERVGKYLYTKEKTYRHF